MKKENFTSKNVYLTINAQAVKANRFIFSTQIGKNAKTNQMENGNAKR
jgi:hypothetical protein